MDMALTGVVTGLGVAFLIILLSTRNLIVSLACAFVIAAVICSVLGVLTFSGWELGDVECLSLMILAGLSVDYIVHLAFAYIESDKEKRIDRVADALAHLGISVFCGMASTFFAAISLVTCQLQIFAKFGTFLMATVLFSYFWSSVFLMSVLATIGPELAGGVSTAPPMKGGTQSRVELAPAAYAT